MTAPHNQRMQMTGLSARMAITPRTTKKLLRQANADQLKSIMKMEQDYFMQMLQGPEAKEAFSAFLEKRKPDFSKFF